MAWLPKVNGARRWKRLPDRLIASNKAPLGGALSFLHHASMAKPILFSLQQSELFRDLDTRSLEALAQNVQWVDLPSGEFLYRRGEPGDSLCLVVNGRVSVSLQDDSGQDRIVGYLGRHEIVGELSVMTGEPRSATVRAVRDSALIRVLRADFEEVMFSRPQAMFKVTRHILERMRRPRTMRAREAVASTRTLAVVAAHDGPDIGAFSAALAEALNDNAAALRLDPARVDGALGEGAAQAVFDSQDRNQAVYSWLNELEAKYRYLIYQGDVGASAWTRRCLRQADRVLVLVDARTRAASSAVLDAIREERVLAPVEFVLLHGEQRVECTEPLAWRALALSQFHHHHVGALSAGLLRPLVRRVTGRALGLVLGGGGARGFAHVGLLRAMNERGLPIDLIGGSSMGALVAAFYASGQRFDEILSSLHELFVENNYLNDYSLTRVSLIRARKFNRRLQEIFNGMRIEELALPYFCVSTNLSRSRGMLHDSGLLHEWVGASMSVPGIAPPIVFKGDLLVDGALVNSVPTDVMATWGRGPVLASDVSSDEELRVEEVRDEPYQLTRVPGEEHRFNLFNILFQTATMTSEEVTAARIKSADLYLRMPVRDIGMLDWKEFEKVVFRGYHHACEALDAALAEGRLQGLSGPATPA